MALYPSAVTASRPPAPEELPRPSVCGRVLLPKERRGELRFARAVSPPSACGLAEVTSVRRGLVPRTFVCAFPHSGGSKLVKSLPSGMVTDVRLPCL
jgi:hypothetical protein